MTDTIKGSIIGALITGFISLLIFILGNFSTQSVLEKQIVVRLSNYFDNVDEKMNYEQAIDAIRQENLELEQLCSEYKEQLQNKQDVTYYNPTFVKDTIPLSNISHNDIAYINERLYISEQVIETLMDTPIEYNNTDNILYINNTKDNNFVMVDLMNTNILYDGMNYTIYKSSEGNNFSIGGVTYTSGFDIHTQGGTDGYVLLNLNNDYSTICFDTGRIDGTDKYEIGLDIFLNGEIYQSYNISPDTPIIHMEIPLNYAQNMKIYFHVQFLSSEALGFTNIYLKK